MNEEYTKLESEGDFTKGYSMLATGLSHNPMSRTLLNSADSLPRCTTPSSILEQSVPQRRSNPKTAGLELEPQFQLPGPISPVPTTFLPDSNEFPGITSMSSGVSVLVAGCARFVSRFWWIVQSSSEPRSKMSKWLGALQQRGEDN